MHIIKIADTYIKETPANKMLAETASDIINTATEHHVDVTATVSNDSNTLVLHHNENNSEDVNTLLALTTLTKSMAKNTTTDHIIDLMRHVLENDHDD